MGLLDEVRAFPRAPRSVRGTTRIPVAGDWDAEKLTLVLAGVHELLGVSVIAVVDAGELGAGDTPERALRDYLESGLPPLWSSRWRGSRTVILGGTLTGTEGTLVSVVESLPPTAADLPHLQPVEWLAAGLRGESTARGGILLVVPLVDAATATGLVKAAGLRAEPWGYSGD